MYCMNCGKEISGNIPICSECLQSVLDKHRAEQDILTRVNLEAQTFSIKEGTDESTIEKSEGESEIQSDDHHDTDTQQIDNDSDSGAMVAAAIIVGIITICLALTAIKIIFGL